MCNNKPAFIGHGSPMNVILENQFTNFLRSYGQMIRYPKAIIVISAHWLTNGTYITGNANPVQIYDFWGFPEELYNIKYTPKGDPEIASHIASSSLGIKIDADRGIDHAGWAVLKHMVPDQSIPLLELSLDIHKSEQEHYELGKKLSMFTDQGILFIGSGNIVHNLNDISFNIADKTFDWALEADKWLAEAIENNEISKIIQYKKYMPDYKHPIPTNEHFVPLLYILGMKTDSERIMTIYEEIQNGSISMRSIEIG